MAEEAKRGARVAFAKDVRVTAGGAWAGKSVDVGGGGLCILLPHELKSGDTLAIAVTGGPPEAQGTVRWVKAEGGAWKIGVQLRAEDWPALAAFAGVPV